MFKKSIPTETISRSMSLVLLSTGIITVVIFMLLVSDVATGRDVAGHHGAFLAYVFESVSAFGTVGLSMGVTPLLSPWSKLWIVLTMIIGRVGVLTFSYIITGGNTLGGKEHAEQNLMVG
jgi:trk system potassium uptake protein TrkH